MHDTCDNDKLFCVSILLVGVKCWDHQKEED